MDNEWYANDYNKQIIIIIIMILFVLINLMKSLNKQLTSKIYVQNTYMYVVIALLLFSLILMMMRNNNVVINNGKSFAMFILTIIIIYGINYTQNKLIRHILWLIFIFSIAYIMQPIYNIIDANTLWKIIITVAILTTGLIYYSSTVDINKFNSWSNYLFYSLLALIIFECFDLVFSNGNSNTNFRYKLYSMIAIILFSGFLLYDTKKIEQNGIILSKLCNNNSNLCDKFLNYPGESLNIFLDIINLFNNITYLETN